MCSTRKSSAALFALMLTASVPATVGRASDAPPSPQASGVQGQGAMDDRNRAGPDGWVQAPIPRTDAARGTAPGEGNPNRSADKTDRSSPDVGRNLPPGQDPGTPMPSTTETPATKP